MNIIQIRANRGYDDLTRIISDLYKFLSDKNYHITMNIGTNGWMSLASFSK